MSDYYPPPSFYFQVKFPLAPLAVDYAFQEVSGLTLQWGTEEIREGGQNMYAHKVPTVPTHENLVLKRGYVSETSALALWCRATLGGNLAVPIVPVPMIVQLLGEDGSALTTWTLLEAWPVKWSISAFNSQENQLAIETLEFSYSTIL